MSHRNDRLHPIGTLTDDERERARRAYEQTPAVLESLYRAALGDGEAAIESMRRVLEEVRPCSA